MLKLCWNKFNDGQRGQLVAIAIEKAKEIIGWKSQQWDKISKKPQIYPALINDKYPTSRILRGYAKEAVITLINEVLNAEIEPNWCTWPYRIESEKLSLSLGDELWDEILAHIWIESECGILK